MTQGASKKSKNEYAKKSTNKKKMIAARPKRVWKKRKDPVRAALIQKAEAIAMAKSMKDPSSGPTKLIKPTEKNTKQASVSTKKLIKEATKRK